MRPIVCHFVPCSAPRGLTNQPDCLSGQLYHIHAHRATSRRGHPGVRPASGGGFLALGNTRTSRGPRPARLSSRPQRRDLLSNGNADSSTDRSPSSASEHAETGVFAPEPRGPSGRKQISPLRYALVEMTPLRTGSTGGVLRPPCSVRTRTWRSSFVRLKALTETGGLQGGWCIKGGSSG